MFRVQEGKDHFNEDFVEMVGLREGCVGVG